MIYKNYNQKYCAISSLLKLVKNHLNNKSVNVEECLITFETLRKYLGHVPGFTRSAPAAFLLTASRCTFWYLVQPLDRIPVETWPAWYATAHAIATPTHQTWKPCVRSP